MIKGIGKQSNHSVIYASALINEKIVPNLKFSHENDTYLSRQHKYKTLHAINTFASERLLLEKK